MSVCGSCSTFDRSFDPRYMLLYHQNGGLFGRLAGLAYSEVREHNTTDTLDPHWGLLSWTIHVFLFCGPLSCFLGKKILLSRSVSTGTTARSSRRQT